MAKDVYPQFLRGSVTESAANTYTQEELSTPVPVKLPNNKYLVMNILKVMVELQMGACDDGDVVASHLADRSHSAVQSPSTAGVIVNASHAAVGAIANGVVNRTIPIVFDLSDGNGHGLLYGKSKIYLGAKGTSQASATTARYAILYTLVEVAPEEYLGMIEGS